MPRSAATPAPQREHVAIMRAQCASKILSGEKTIESRLYRSRQAPVGRVSVGDTIYIKQSSGPFRALATVARVLERELDSPADLHALREKYEPKIHGGAEYWISKAQSRYAVLMWLTDVRPCDQGPPQSAWRSPGTRQAWFTLDDRTDRLDRKTNGARKPARAAQTPPGSGRSRSQPSTRAARSR